MYNCRILCSHYRSFSERVPNITAECTSNITQILSDSVKVHHQLTFPINPLKLLTGCLASHLQFKIRVRDTVTRNPWSYWTVFLF